MAIDLTDPFGLFGASGFSTDTAKDAADAAEAKFLGSSDDPAGGGLIPAFDLESQFRTDFLDQFNLEKDRILEETAVNAEQQQLFNDVAIAQLPGLEAAATPEGFAARIAELSGDPTMQAITAREQEQRMRAATAQLSAGGLQRSGAAASAAAEATLTNEEFAFQTEQTLFDRSLGLAGLHKELPIAQMMVANTLERDLSLADNLIAQGAIQGNTELLKSQIEQEAATTAFDNLFKLLGTDVADTSILDNVLGQVEDLWEGITGGDGFLTNVMGGIIGGILGVDIFGGGDGTKAPIEEGVGEDVGGATEPAAGTEAPVDAGGAAPGTGEPVDETLEEAITSPIPGVDPAGVQAVAEKIQAGTASQAEIDQFNAGLAKNPEFIAAVEALLAAQGDKTPLPGDTDLPPGTTPPTDDFPFPDLPSTTVPGDTGINVPPPDSGGTGIGDIIGGGVGGGSDESNILDFDGASSFAPTAGSSSIPTGGGLPGVGFGDPTSELAGFLGTKMGESFIGRTAQSGYGATAGAILGNVLLPGAGALIGGFLGGIADVAMGEGDQKDVNFGVSTTKPGDDQVGDVITGDSGLKFYTIARDAGSVAASEYTDTILGIDSYFTALSESLGVDVKFSSDTFSDAQSDAVTQSGPDLKFNPTYFGHNGEGSKENEAIDVDNNLNAGVNNFVGAWAHEIAPQLSETQQQQIDTYFGPEIEINSDQSVQILSDILMGNPISVSSKEIFGMLPGLELGQFKLD